MSVTIQVNREETLAFRQSVHNLTERLPVKSLIDVAGACGVRNTPPGSAPIGLLARLDALTPEDVDRALEAEGVLVEVLSVRASPLVVPRRDVGVFTIGALPRTEDLARIGAGEPQAGAGEAGYSASAALDLAVAAAHEALADGGLTRGELSAAVTKELPKPLRAWCPGCKVHHVPEMLFRLIGVHGEYVITREGKGSTYVRADKVLGKRAKANATKARAELLRRYLRCFGPTTAADFAAWVGIAASEAEEDWDRLGDSLMEVDLAGRQTWIHSGRCEDPARSAVGRGNATSPALRCLPRSARPRHADTRESAASPSLASHRESGRCAARRRDHWHLAHPEEGQTAHRDRGGVRRILGARER